MSGNCWFIAAASAVTLNPDLIKRVVPANQTFDEDDYAGICLIVFEKKTNLFSSKGIFHFRFWLYGQWVDVVIDDRLPFHSDGRLVFCCNKKDKNEMWAPLLEKAFAKYEYSHVRNMINHFFSFAESAVHMKQWKVVLQPMLSLI